ncbi:MAG TPA: Na/Pi cotransporter family protein [Geminicoccaceae bacterium]|nr:Na/Pi cotransporter family protein [Geminicoccaceae bacterium]
MSGTEILIDILGGVALLLWGVRMIRTGMMRAFGASLRAAIGVWTGNRVKAALAGTLAAAMVQSSTATALMVCSFVAHGALSTAPALAVMLGADLGAAIGAQIFTSGGVAGLWPALALLGYLMHTLFERRNVRLRHVGRVVLGLAILLLALTMIGRSAQELSSSNVLHVIMQAVAGEPLLAIITGALLTWAAYSSLAMILLVAALASSDLLAPASLFPIVLGINLGAALPAITATIAEPRVARRIPLGNLIFRLAGVLVALPFLGPLEQYLVAFDPEPVRLIVNLHLLFNLALCLGLLAFIGPIGQLVDRLLPEAAGAAEDNGPRHLDESLLDTPPVALAMAARETLRMGDVIEAMLANSLRVLEQNDDQLRREVEATDDELDQLHEAIKLYLTRLSRNELDDEDSQRAVDIIAFTTNLEHVGDIVDKNLMELAAKKIRNRLQFSAEGLQDLKEMHAHLMETVRLSLTVFINQDLAMARALLERKDQLREMELNSTERHLGRLRSGKVASIETSSLHLDVIRDLKRINSHLASVAYPILDRAGVLRPTRLRRKPKAEARRQAASAEAEPVAWSGDSVEGTPRPAP